MSAGQAVALASAGGQRSALAPSRVVVGVHDGHNAAVALVENGRLQFALQEERLTRVKNQGDAPELALAQALGMASSTGGSPRVALNGHYMNYGQWDRETVLADYQHSSGWLGRLKQSFKNTFVDRVYQSHKAAQRTDRLLQLGLAEEQLASVEHHRAHAAAAYYTAPWRPSLRSWPERTLVLTCDGSGDRLCATVSIGEGATLSRVAHISEHDSIGRLYALVTRYLGMVPLEHEYKVMGLAPYASSSRGAAYVAGLLGDLFEFTADALVWRRKRGVPSMYAAYGFLERLLAGQRFDHVAAGVQLFLESMLTAWVRHAIRETGIRRVACSGGVFMNVKANLAVLELDEVEEMYVFPSCGDESNAIGAACWEAARLGDCVQPLGGMYFGDPISDDDSRLALEVAVRAGARLHFHWEHDIERVTAQKVAEGKVVARAKGAMEFGARALGNRSILARADSTPVVRFINEAIKCRDFWMPFAPSVLAERASLYYDKPKSVASPYMMFAFRARPEKASVFAAAQHPYDATTRPHEVFAEHNPLYHRLLEEYEAMTGEGILLNTSFNLHGEPIVYSAADAVGVLTRSGLEYLALGNWWVEKRA
ncbi:MAG: carbamoyltransferase C-terminal domain-containing protein [Acidobacteriota bacterium]